MKTKPKKIHSNAYLRAMAKLDTMKSTADYINPAARQETQKRYRETKEYKASQKKYIENNKEKLRTLQKHYYQKKKAKQEKENEKEILIIGESHETHISTK